VSKKRYVVELGMDERKRLEDLIRKGKTPAKEQLNARILLQADESSLGPKWSDPRISEALGTYPIMCARVRQQFAQAGVDAVLNRKQCAEFRQWPETVGSEDRRRDCRWRHHLHGEWNPENCSRYRTYRDSMADRNHDRKGLNLGPWRFFCKRMRGQRKVHNFCGIMAQTHQAGG
jgi:hypothetical protein